MAATATAARTRTINIRIEEERRTLIDRAAEAAGKDRTQFVLDAATREATTVLLDQGIFRWTQLRSRSSTLPWMRLPPRTRGCGSFSLEKLPGSDECGRN
jgi:uncharacterized protein (DUF1778 family)